MARYVDDNGNPIDDGSRFASTAKPRKTYVDDNGMPIGEEQPQPPNIGDEITNGLRSTNQFLMGGAADEYEGAVRATMDLLTGKIAPHDWPNTFERYRSGSDAARADFEARRPLVSVATKTAGGLATLPLTAASTGARTALAAEQAVASPFTAETAAMLSKQAARRAADAARAARPLVESAKTGVIGGALGGYLGADNQNRWLGTGAGAVSGAVLGPAMTAAVAAPALARDATDKARSMVRRAFEEGGALRDATDNAGNVIPQVQRNANLLQSQTGPVEETVAEIGGPSAQGLARALANVPGPGQEVARDVLQGRRQGLPTTEATPWWSGKPEKRASMADRVMSAANKSAGNPKDWGETVVMMATEGRKRHNENYKGALQSAADVGIGKSDFGALSDDIDNHLYDVDNGPGIIPENLGTMPGLQRARNVINTLGQLSSSGKFTLAGVERIRQTLNQIRRSVSGSDGYDSGAVGQVIGKLDKKLDEIAEARAAAGDPRFKQELDSLKAVREDYGSDKQLGEAMDQGLRVLKDDAVDTALWMHNDGRGRSQAEKDGYMSGVVKAIQDAVDRNDAAAIARIARDRSIQDSLVQSLGKVQANRLMTRVRREASMNGNTNAILAGSRTTPMREEIDKWTEGEDDLSFISDMVMNPTPVRNIFLKAFQAAYNRTRRPGIYNQEINKAVADMLYNRATRDGVATLLQAIKSDPQALAAARTAARNQSRALMDDLQPARVTGSAAGQAVSDPRRDVWIESSRDLPNR
jgi:hypothetical protein